MTLSCPSTIGRTALRVLDSAATTMSDLDWLITLSRRYASYGSGTINVLTGGVRAVATKAAGICAYCAASLFLVIGGSGSLASSSSGASSIITNAAGSRGTHFQIVTSVTCAQTLGDSESSSRCVMVMGVSIAHS